MPKQQSAQPATVGAAEYNPEATNSAEAIIGSACPCRYSRIQSRNNNRLSLPLPIQQNTGLSRYTYTFHNASQRRGQEGKSARRGDGLRNYECFPFSQITHFQKVKTIIQKNQTLQFPSLKKSENHNPKSKLHNHRFKGSRPTTSFVNHPMRTPARTPATSRAGA